MTRNTIKPTGREVRFSEDEIIVTKTDLKGIITYANEVFIRVSSFQESELIGYSHNIIRHPEMPRCIFKLFWDYLKSGREIFAYVVNLSADGGHYWVFAHVTPSPDSTGKTIGYHSNRRSPYADALAKIIPLYKTLLDEEKKHTDPNAAIAASTALLEEILAKEGCEYNQFIFNLSRHTCLEASVI